MIARAFISQFKTHYLSKVINYEGFLVHHRSGQMRAKNDEEEFKTRKRFFQFIIYIICNLIENVFQKLSTKYPK